MIYYNELKAVKHVIVRLKLEAANHVISLSQISRHRKPPGLV